MLAGDKRKQRQSPGQQLGYNLHAATKVTNENHAKAAPGQSRWMKLGGEYGSAIDTLWGLLIMAVKDTRTRR